MGDNHHNRISRYLPTANPRDRLYQAERDLDFIVVMQRLGFEYTTSADRIARMAAKQRSEAQREMRK